MLRNIGSRTRLPLITANLGTLLICLSILTRKIRMTFVFSLQGVLRIKSVIHVKCLEECLTHRENQISAAIIVKRKFPLKVVFRVNQVRR